MKTAKIPPVLILCLALLWALSSCALEPESASEAVGVGRLVTVEYPSEIVRTPHVVGSFAPELSVILSREELIAYVSVYEKCYDFMDDGVTSTFYDVVTGYNEAFFSSKGLVVCVLHAPNPSVRYVSEGIGRTPEGYDLRIKVTSPATSSTEETAWHLFLEVPDSAAFLRNPSTLHTRLVTKKGY